MKAFKKERQSHRSASHQAVKKVLTVLSAYKSLAEFRHPQMTEGDETTFFPRTCASEKTLFRPQVCEQRECAQRTASLL